MRYRSIREASEAIHKGLVTPSELVTEAFERIDESDYNIHAFITVMRDQAYEEAEKAEREQHNGFFRGPLHGIPIGVKDIIAVKDVRMTAGSKVLAQYIPCEDATVVQQVRKAGGIIVGKTNTHEFASGDCIVPTRNPWNQVYFPGGSSVGSAAALVTGMCLGAIGTDTGGSIRIPAAFCGITGLKPTYGRVSCYGLIPLSWSFDHVGPMGSSAEDCAILLDATAGYDSRDPNSISILGNQFLATLIAESDRHNPPPLQNLKLGIPQETFLAPLDSEVRQAWYSVMHVLSQLGAEIVDVELPHFNLRLYNTIQEPEASLVHMEKGWLTEQREAYGERAIKRLLRGLKISAVDYLQAQYQLHIFSSLMFEAMQQIDALLLPTLPISDISVEQAEQEDISIDGITESTLLALMRLTVPFNLTGLPAISFPCGFTSRGLPIGMQVVGKRFDEAMVLRIVHAYQQITTWHLKEVPASS